MSISEDLASLFSDAPLSIEPPTTGDQPAEPPRLTPETIRLWSAFSPLTPERRRWALTVGEVAPVRAGDAFQAAGEVAVVVAGCISTSIGDTSVSAEILGPGSVIATGAERPLFGRWITDGEVYRVSFARWIQAAGVEGALHLLAAADQRRASLERRVFCATTHRADARIADLYLGIQASAAPQGIALSQEQVGDMLGMRRTTVNACSRLLEKSGASRSSRGRIRIVDIDVLAQTACGCRHVRSPRSDEAAGKASGGHLL